MELYAPQPPFELVFQTHHRPDNGGALFGMLTSLRFWHINSTVSVECLIERFIA